MSGPIPFVFYPKGATRRLHMEGLHMRLKKLILHGFKSFADRTEFDFEKPVTCIVGPNGCGKSNVVDAVKWVLGEQSAKSLRGGAMLDVIFNGAESRKPSAIAEVTLVFENPTRDDGSRFLQIDSDDVSVARKLWRDGSSEYVINHRTARLRDIKDLFLDTGVGVDAYSVIEQGRVAALLEANPEGCPAAELISGVRRMNVDQPVMILVISGTVPVAVLSGLVSVGADDFLTKPFTPIELRSRIRALLGRRDMVHGRRVLTMETMRLGMNELTRTPAPAIRPAPTTNSWDLMTVTLSRLIVEAGFLAPGFRSRIARYVRAMSQKVSGTGEYARLKDSSYLTMLAASASLFDIGLLVIPGGLTLKPGKLDEDERQVMETHPVVGAEIIAGLADKFPSEMGCVSLASELILGHHERWDGLGYPERIAGTEIPLSARVVAIASVYDSLRSRRPYRPALTHSRAMRTIVTECAGRYDPVLIEAFEASAARIETVYNEYPV